MWLCVRFKEFAIISSILLCFFFNCLHCIEGGIVESQILDWNSGVLCQVVPVTKAWLQYQGILNYWHGSCFMFFPLVHELGHFIILVMILGNCFEMFPWNLCFKICWNCLFAKNKKKKKTTTTTTKQEQKQNTKPQESRRTFMVLKVVVIHGTYLVGHLT